MSKDKCIHDKIIEEFHKLHPMFNGKLSLPEYLETLQVALAKDIFMCAPNIEEAKNLINHAVNAGLNWAQDIKNEEV